ncbi:MAG: S-methyl-5'-thioadenosine phosphorylase [Chloroflexi bacterium]|nr:MAG: S-methyl-5'-thioadenosine phosphorylase [Chloroflexota bacterium]
MNAVADFAVIGGSGLYHLLDDAQSIAVDTPYGPPSEAVTLGTVAGRRVAFLPRHGARHTIPPHRINYRANIWGLRSMGVERVLAPCAVGSLRVDRAPGEVVVCDQLVDRTHSRADTFYEGPEVAHLSGADLYCEELGPLAAAASRSAGLVVHERGTVVVVQGPRFSTRAESRIYAGLGCDLVNMTQYPEVALARELGMCYVAIALVTDYDSGLEGRTDVAAVTQKDVLAVFNQNIAKLRVALLGLLERMPARRGCRCAAGVPVVMTAGEAMVPVSSRQEEQ